MGFYSRGEKPASTPNTIRKSRAGLGAGLGVGE